MVRNLNWSEIINRPSEKELYEANTNKIQLMRFRGGFCWELLQELCYSFLCMGTVFGIGSWN